MNISERVDMPFHIEIPPIPWCEHSIALLGLPHTLLPVSPLAAPANTLVSLPLQLMKATVLAESSLSYHQVL